MRKEVFSMTEHKYIQQALRLSTNEDAVRLMKYFYITDIVRTINGVSIMQFSNVINQSSKKFDLLSARTF